jgi:hypothetical protein
MFEQLLPGEKKSERTMKHVRYVQSLNVEQRNEYIDELTARRVLWVVRKIGICNLTKYDLEHIKIFHTKYILKKPVHEGSLFNARFWALGFLKQHDPNHYNETHSVNYEAFWRPSLL